MNSEELKELKGVKLICHKGYYDGPLSGFCLYEDNRYWFECSVYGGWENKNSLLPGTLYEEDFELDDSGEILVCVKRIYEVIELTKEQWKDEDIWHRFWMTYMGTHTNYGEDGKRISSFKPRVGHYSDYYEIAKLRKKPDYSQNKKIGWFTI